MLVTSLRYTPGGGASNPTQNFLPCGLSCCKKKICIAFMGSNFERRRLHGVGGVCVYGGWGRILYMEKERAKQAEERTLMMFRITGFLDFVLRLGF
jgi:hypothetical protein